MRAASSHIQRVHVARPEKSSFSSLRRLRFVVTASRALPLLALGMTAMATPPTRAAVAAAARAPPPGPLTRQSTGAPSEASAASTTAAPAQLQPDEEIVLMKKGHRLNELGHTKEAFDAFAECYRKGRRIEARLSAANMKLKLSRETHTSLGDRFRYLRDAIKEYHEMLSRVNSVQLVAASPRAHAPPSPASDGSFHARLPLQPRAGAGAPEATGRTPGAAPAAGTGRAAPAAGAGRTPTAALAPLAAATLAPPPKLLEIDGKSLLERVLQTKLNECHDQYAELERLGKRSLKSRHAVAALPSDAAGLVGAAPAPPSLFGRERSEAVQGQLTITVLEVRNLLPRPDSHSADPYVVMRCHGVQPKERLTAVRKQWRLSDPPPSWAKEPLRWSQVTSRAEPRTRCTDPSVCTLYIQCDVHRRHCCTGCCCR